MEGEEYRPKDEIIYHFNKDELYGDGRRRIENPKKSRPFRDNKTLLIILLDIGVIVLFALVIVPLLRKPYSVGNFEGYSVSLASFVSKNKIFVSLEIENGKESSGDKDGGEIGRVIYYTKEDYSSDPETIILPEPGKKKVYDYSFDNKGQSRVYARLSINGNTTGLRVKVSR